MGDMTDSSDIDCCLSRDDLWVQRGHFGDVEIIECLGRQMSLGEHSFLLSCDDFLLRLSLEHEGSLGLGSLFLLYFFSFYHDYAV